MLADPRQWKSNHALKVAAEPLQESLRLDAFSHGVGLKFRATAGNTGRNLCGKTGPKRGQLWPLVQILAHTSMTI